MAQITKKFPFTGKELETLTDGYVNSGVLRGWVSDGRIAAGARGKGRGGPRTFSLEMTIKAVVMAELRKFGVSLDWAERWAGDFAAEFGTKLAIHESGDIEGNKEYLLKQPACYAITPSSGEVVPIMPADMVENFADVINRFGATVTIFKPDKIFTGVRMENVRASRRLSKRNKLERFYQSTTTATLASKRLEEALAAHAAAPKKSQKVRSAAERDLKEAIISSNAALKDTISAVSSLEQHMPDDAPEMDILKDSAKEIKKTIKWAEQFLQERKVR